LDRISPIDGGRHLDATGAHDRSARSALRHLLDPAA
jgi:hypothetical protein